MAQFSGRKMLNEKNTFTIPRVSGVYRLFGENGKKLYIGVAKRGDHGNLRHRIQSYRQKDNFKGEAGHPEKKQLRKKVVKFDFAKMSIKEAREFEHSKKHNFAFNRNHVVRKSLPNGKYRNIFVEEKHVTHKKSAKNGFTLKKSARQRKGLENFFK
jgi:excinuclease UvrABC nuclease subunit